MLKKLSSFIFITALLFVAPVLLQSQLDVTSSNINNDFKDVAGVRLSDLAEAKQNNPIPTDKTPDIDNKILDAREFEAVRLAQKQEDNYNFYNTALTNAATLELVDAIILEAENYQATDADTFRSEDLTNLKQLAGTQSYNLYNTALTNAATLETVEAIVAEAEGRDMFSSEEVLNLKQLAGTQTKEIEARLEKEAEERRIKEERLAKEAEEAAKAAQAAAEKAKATTTYSGGGTKNDWMTAAGIPSSQWWAVDSIVSGESGWNPSAVNPSSGACGLGQQLPCGKWNSYGAWNDPVANLVAMTDYVNGRYGSWAAAVEFRNCVGQCYSSYYAATGGYTYKDHTWY